MAETSLAQDPAPITPEDGSVFVYPHPLALARDHAEAERIRLADSAAYSAMCRTWGQLGGLATLHKYGRRHFALLARVRWGDAEALIELAAHIDRRRRRA